MVINDGKIWVPKQGRGVLINQGYEKVVVLDLHA